MVLILEWKFAYRQQNRFVRKTTKLSSFQLMNMWSFWNTHANFSHPQTQRKSINFLNSSLLKTRHALDTLPFVFQYVKIIEFSSNMCLSNPFHYVIWKPQKADKVMLNAVVVYNNTHEEVSKGLRTKCFNVFEGCVRNCSEDNFGHNTKHLICICFHP